MYKGTAHAVMTVMHYQYILLYSIESGTGEIEDPGSGTKHHPYNTLAEPFDGTPRSFLLGTCNMKEEIIITSHHGDA